MEIGIQQRFPKFTANIFPIDPPVMRTIASITLISFANNYTAIIGHAILIKMFGSQGQSVQWLTCLDVWGDLAYIADIL